MAYINGMGSRSSMSSIYGNRNVISGLASGLDTESMIENAISGYKMKVEKLIQQRTLTEWRQTSYRSIIEKMALFSDKYTSYKSNSNLMSPAYFNSAVKVSTVGTHADKVSASGRTDSAITVLGVKQLATSATYGVSGLGGGAQPQIQGDSIKLTDKQDISQIKGTMSINYGGNNVIDLEFGADEVYKDTNSLAKAIEEKLSKENIAIGSSTYKASEKIGVKVAGESIEFYDKGSAGNEVYISGVSGDLKDTLGITPDKDNKVTSFSTAGKPLYKEGTVGEVLSGKTLEVTLDGVTRKITMPSYTKGDGSKLTNKELVEGLQKEFDKAFGTGRITVTNEAADKDTNVAAMQLNFKTQEGSAIKMKGEAVEPLGFKNTASYVDATRNLGDIWGDKIDWDKTPKSEAVGTVKDITTKEEGEGADKKKVEYGVDEKGYAVKKADDGKFYRVDSDGNFLHDFTINGVVVGQFNKHAELSTVLRAINTNAEAGVNVSYSQTTDRFQFTAKNSGEAGKITMGDGSGNDLAAQMFGSKNGVTVQQADGQDAILSMSVNGQVLDGIRRSDNTFNVDGMNITLKETFGEYKEDGVDTKKYVLADQAAAQKEAVSFKSTADADKIVETVKSMVEDYNAMVEEIKKAYSDLPNQKTNGAKYLPLTAKQREGMSESEIKAYEEKAKQGILFADRDLSSLYDRLRRGISMAGQDGVVMRDIGLSTSYSNGLTTLKLDENKLRAALETDPDKVRDFFTKTSEDGSGTVGFMQGIKEPLDEYGKVTGGKGVLVEKAGSPLAGSTLYNNLLQQEMDRYDKQISALEKKMNSQIDRYTQQFSKMEQMIATMNAQSSSLAGLMGGGGF